MNKRTTQPNPWYLQYLEANNNFIEKEKESSALKKRGSKFRNLLDLESENSGLAKTPMPPDLAKMMSSKRLSQGKLIRS